MAQYNIDTTQRHYSGPHLKTESDILLEGEQIVLKGQPVLPTNLGNTSGKVLTIDFYGQINAVESNSLVTSVNNLQAVTDVGNATTNTIVQAPAESNQELATLGQLYSVFADLISATPDILILIQQLQDQIDDGDPQIQDLFDLLALKVDKTELGVTVQELVGGVLPLNQAPLLTLQHICNNGSITTTNITAQPAISGEHLVTLQQVQSLVNSGQGNLQEVLSAGNVSNLNLILEDEIDDNIVNTISKAGQIVQSAITNNRQFITDYSQDKITFSYIHDTGTETATLEVYNYTTVPVEAQNSLWEDRIITKLKGIYVGALLTTADMGHSPLTGLGINADMLDGHHMDAFILQSTFPVNTTGAIIGNTLIYNGTTWVPGASSGSGTGLTIFSEAVIGTYQTFAPISLVSDVHLKTNTNKNLQIGLSKGTITGTDNTLFSKHQTGPTISGNSNLIYALTGSVFGSNNWVFSNTINVQLNSNSNFIVDTPQQIGDNSNPASNNVILKFTLNSGSPAGFKANYATILNSRELLLTSTIDCATNAFIANVYNTSIGNKDVAAIRVDNSSLIGINSTGINLKDSTISGNGAFGSGTGLYVPSFSQIVFGTYNTVDAGSPSQTTVINSDRQFVIGSGTTSARRNSITIWKSGQTELRGTLKLGSYSENEFSVNPIEGSLRYNSSTKVIEIYRNSTWDTDLGGNGSILTADQLQAIQNANEPQANNTFITQNDHYRTTRKLTVLDTLNSTEDLFPTSMIVNHEMDMFITPVSPPDVGGTPIKITAINTSENWFEVDFFPYLDGEATNAQNWLVSKSVGTDGQRTAQDQQYAFILEFIRNPNTKGGRIIYDPDKSRQILSSVSPYTPWDVDTTIFYINITRDWDYNLNSTNFKISNTNIVGNWRRSTVAQGNFFRTKTGELRLVVNGLDMNGTSNQNLWKRTIGLSWPLDQNDLTGDWYTDDNARITMNDFPQWCSATGFVLTSVIKSPTEDCWIGYGNTYGATGVQRVVGWVKFNDDMSWFQFGETPVDLDYGSTYGYYQPSVVFYNGKYRLAVAFLNNDTSPDNGNWELKYYESTNPLGDWVYKSNVTSIDYRDIKDCFMSSHSTEVSMFILHNKLCAFVDGTSRWNAQGNRGQRQIGLMFFDDAKELWIPYRPGVVFAGYQFSNLIWNLPFGHTGGIQSLTMDKEYLYFATQLTQQSDQYKIVISRKKIR